MNRVKLRRWTVLLVACTWVLWSSIATAGISCPYDVTGAAHYNPNLVFIGDGQITYDPTLPWYLDDTNACAQVAAYPLSYAHYFPKCDVDGDLAVTMDDVYAIYYRVRPVEAPNAVAQRTCVEALGDPNMVFCPQGAYDKAVLDMETIMAVYPMTQAIVDPEARSLGQRSAGVEGVPVRCDGAMMPIDAFDDLADCYDHKRVCWNPDGAGNCEQFDFVFENMGVNSPLVVGDYAKVAAEFGGTCEALDHTPIDSFETPGFHFAEVAGNGWYLWTVRTTAECVGPFCECDITYQLWTNKDDPSQLIFDNMIDRSSPSCTYTGCRDDDDDGVTDCMGDECPYDPYRTYPDPECGSSCVDLADIDWGTCQPKPLGAAVLDGQCRVVFGCEIPTNVTLYTNVIECQAMCEG